MTTRKRFALSLLLCLFLCVCLAPAAMADGPLDELQAAINRGDGSYDMSNKGDVTLTGNLIIPEGFFVNAMSGTRIIVPAGTTLTTSGTMEISALRLEGGTVEVRGGIFRVNGKFEPATGTVEVYAGYNIFPAADVWPNNTGAFSYPDGPRKVSLLFPATNGTELAAAIGTANELTENFLADIAVKGDCVLTGSHSVPHQGNIRVLGEQNGSLTVAKDAALTYAGGGNIFLYGGAAAAVNGVLVLNGGTTVDPGCTLTVNGIMETGGLYLGGTAELNENCIFRTNRDLHPEGGTVKVLGQCFNLFPAADVWPDSTGVIEYAGDALKTNLLFAPKNDGEFASAVSTINALTDRYVADVNINNQLHLTGQHILKHQTELRVAGGVGGALAVEEGAALVYENCGGNLTMSNNGNPNCGAVSGNRGTLIANVIDVQPGCEFRSAGIVETANLKLGGDVEVGDGIFRVNRKLEPGGGTVRVYSGFNAFPAADVWPNNADVIEFEEDGLKTNLLFRPQDEGEFADAVSAANELPEEFVADMIIDKAITITDGYSLTHRTEIRVNSGNGGALTVEEGAALSYDDCGGNVFFYNNGKTGDMPASFVRGMMLVNTVEVQPGCVLVMEGEGFLSTNEAKIEGALENNGFLELRKRYSGTEPRMIVTGAYLGGGAIGVMDHENTDSYFEGLDLTRFTKEEDEIGTLYTLRLFDLALPADLTEIGEEAFANGSFHSVYIPEGVVSIADTAFDGVDDLTIYGVEGSEAQRFAEEQGFSFEPLA